MTCTATLCRHTDAGVPCLCREGDTRRVCGEPESLHHMCLGCPGDIPDGWRCAFCRGTGLALGHAYQEATG
jgi:hypothetical protein